MAGGDTVIYTDMKEEEVDEIVEFLEQDFFEREPFAHGVHLTPSDVEDWLRDAVVFWQTTGVSVVARGVAGDGDLLGVMLSTVLNKGGGPTFEGAANSKNEKSRVFGGMATEVEKAVNVYEQFSVDRVVELAFLSVKASCGGRGIGTQLCKESERRGLALGCQAATVQATNIFTQRIFDKLGYVTVAEMAMTEFTYKGAPAIDPTTIGDNLTAKMMVRKFS